MIDSVIERAIEYKRKISGGYLSINGDDIETKVSGKKIYVSTKIDGEFNLLWYDGNKSVIVNGNGKVKSDIPVLKGVTDILSQKGISSLLAAVELHLEESEKRSRVFEVKSAIANNADGLTLSIFDLLEVGGEKYLNEDYKALLDKADELFDGSRINTVPISEASSPSEVLELFEQIVSSGGAEGLVIRSADHPIIYKAKPLCTLDAAIIGFTEGEQGKIREILLGMMHEDGTYSQIGRTGNGLSEEQKTALYESLSKNIINSPYIVADKRKVAFYMVKPEVVAEVSANELLTENSKGKISNPLLSFDNDTGWSFITNTSGVSLLHPVYKRIRDDKLVNEHDIRFSQITDLVSLSKDGEKQSRKLPQSEIVFREVYTKTSKGKTNVQKFVVWKTHKDAVDDRWLGYVLHYTNFSPTRAEPLKRDVRVSSSEEQIMLLKDEFVMANIKKGWKQV